MKRTFASLALTLAVFALVATFDGGCSVKARRDQHLARAQKYLGAGDYDRAEIEFLNVLQLDPGNPTAIGDLGIIYFDQGRFGSAVPYLLKGREMAPDNLDARIRLAKTFLAGGKSKEARAEIDYVLAHKPTDPEAPLVLAQTVTGKTGDLGAVQQRLTAMLQSAPGNASLHVALGTLELRQRHLKEAEEELNRAQQLDPNSSPADAALGALALAKGDLPQAEKMFARSADLAPDRSLRKLQYARFEIQRNDLPGAHAALQKIVQKTPDFLPAATMLVELLLLEKKNDEAAVLIERLLTRDPNNLEVLVLSGRVKVALGQPEKATATLEKACTLFPQSALAHYQYALVLVSRGKTKEATASLNRAIALDPEFTDANLLLAGISMINGDLSGAISTLGQVLQKHPENIRAQTMLADAYREHGDLDEALRLYENLEQHLGGRPELPLARGVVLARQGRTEEARKAFNRALELAPDFFPAFEQLLNLDLKEKQYDAALLRTRQLAERKPQSPEPQLFLARIALAQADVSAAAAALEKAIAIQPDYRPAYIMAASVYADAHEAEKALERLRKLVQQNPKDIAALMIIGTLCEQQQQFQSARDAYEKVLAVEPRFSPALNNLAYIYGEYLGNLDKASELGQKARELRPGDPRIADTLGWILYKKGEYNRALPLLQEGASQLPGDLEVQCHLGMARYMLGDAAAAQTALQRALAPGTTFPGVEEARHLLAFLLLQPGPEQRAAIDKRLSTRPDDPVALARLAQLHERDGDLAAAHNTYQALLDKRPQNVTALAGLARLMQKRGLDQAKALELARTAYKLDPDDPTATYIFGRLAYSTGDYRLAESLLRSAERKQGNNPALLFDLATAECSLGEIDEAAATMRTAFQIADPAFANANEARLFVEMLALAADPAGTPAAQTRVDEVVKSHPDFLPALAAKAALAERTGDVKTSMETCEAIVRRFPYFTPATRRLALLLAADGTDDKRAASLLYSARATYPNDPDLARALGLTLFRTGDFPRATTFLKESAAATPNDANVLFCLGLAQAKIKDRDAARASLSHALDLDPNNTHSGEARQILSQLK